MTSRVRKLGRRPTLRVVPIPAMTVRLAGPEPHPRYYDTAAVQYEQTSPEQLTVVGRTNGGVEVAVTLDVAALVAAFEGFRRAAGSR